MWIPAERNFHKGVGGGIHVVRGLNVTIGKLSLLWQVICDVRFVVRRQEEKWSCPLWLRAVLLALRLPGN